MRAISFPFVLLVAACQPAPAGQVTTPQKPFDGIQVAETIRLLGTEPFWGGTLADGTLRYTHPENEAGELIPVKRFAGNNGLGFSGSRNGQPLDLMITKGVCSDGMSDRSFPYTATLRLGSEQRNGCAWTDREPYTDPAAG